MVKLFKRKKRPDKHKVTIIYKDYIEDLEIPYPENGIYELKDGTVYYLDPAKTRHIFVHGYVNEVDGAKVHVEVDPKDVHKIVQRLEFEPSFTFKNAYENRILQQLLRSAEGTQFSDKAIWILVGAVAVLGVLVWNMYTHLIELMKFVGMNV